MTTQAAPAGTLTPASPAPPRPPRLAISPASPRLASPRFASLPVDQGLHGRLDAPQLVRRRAPTGHDVGDRRVDQLVADLVGAGVVPEGVGGYRPLDPLRHQVRPRVRAGLEGVR